MPAIETTEAQAISTFPAIPVTERMGIWYNPTPCCQPYQPFPNRTSSRHLGPGIWRSESSWNS